MWESIKAKLSLKCQILLAIMETEHENTEEIALFWRLLNEAHKIRYQYEDDLDPVG